MVTLGHISDLHVTAVRPSGVRSLLNKRALGWLSWNVRRRKIHRADVLEALLADLSSQTPDRVVITGDLTNVALEAEFVEAARWLRRIGTPDRVFAVPGNHDAYVTVARARSIALWSDYLASDAEGAELARSSGGVAACSPSGAAPDPADALAFPTVRFTGPVALVGVSSAVPTPPLFATGTVGPGQLARLEAILERLGREGRCRVVLIHHPPAEGVVSPRRALTDGAEFRAVLHRAGAELVLHGHTHRTLVSHLDGPGAPIPVVGVRSASDGSDRDEKRAHYHVYQIEPGAGAGPGRYRIGMRVRGFEPASHAFRDESGEARDLSAARGAA